MRRKSALFELVCKSELGASNPLEPKRESAPSQISQKLAAVLAALAFLGVSPITLGHVTLLGLNN